MVRKISEVCMMGGRHVLCCGCWGAVVFLLFLRAMHMQVLVLGYSVEGVSLG